MLHRLVVAMEMAVVDAAVAVAMDISFGRVGMLPTQNLGTAARRPSHNFLRSYTRQIFDSPIRLMLF